MNYLFRVPSGVQYANHHVQGNSLRYKRISSLTSKLSFDDELSDRDRTIVS